MKRFSISLGLALTTLSLLAAGASPAQACLFSVQVREPSDGSNVTESGPTAVDSGEVSFPSNLGVPNSYVGRAAAGPGMLRARGLARVQGIPAMSHNASGNASAFFILDDVIITGPVGVTSVNATMNIDVDGVMPVIVTQNSGPAASFALRMQLPGNVTTGAIDINGVAGTTTSTGLLAGFDGPTVSGHITSGVGTFSTTGPNTVKIDINAGAVAGASGGILGEFSEAQSNFFNTVHFPTSGPVFNLPAGFTANSVCGLIVNNQWAGAVPEPSTGVLAIVAGGLMWWWRKRFK